MQPRAPEQSKVSLHQLMMPEHANTHGNVHGGVIMKMMDETGAICAMRHAGRVCVTMIVDSMKFLSPAHVGQLMCCSGHVTWVGTTSIEVEVQVHAEDVVAGTITHTNSGHFVYVALDESLHPTSVPRLLLQTDAERQAFANAEQRRAQRLARP